MCVQLDLLFVFLSVSFYGNSFVELNMAESSSQTSVQLRFRTSKPHGLLFLAAGKKDYCVMELHSGILQVWFITIAKMIDVACIV